tara:strand:- start:73 stop:291 length:219 start_codon:yes stop_codon:yes gene_type:complete
VLEKGNAALLIILDKAQHVRLELVVLRHFKPDENTENGTIKQFPFRNGKENGKWEIRMDIPRFPFPTSGTPF